jgi:hypothetical protein
MAVDSDKYKLPDYIERFNYYFEMCGCQRFAIVMAPQLVCDADKIKEIILSFSKSEIIEAASFHGNIGEGKKTLDSMAQNEQKLVFDEDENVRKLLLKNGEEYLAKFGMKFLISAKDKTANELAKALNARINNSEDEELKNARVALLEITQKRLQAHPLNNIQEKLLAILKKNHVQGANIALTSDLGFIETINIGVACENKPVQKNTWFELASLSKTVASAFALEYFNENQIDINTSVNQILEQTESNFRLSDDKVLIKHLMNHTALNMHYVNGVPANEKMPAITDFLNGNDKYGYEKVAVANPPGTKFKYSGAGFIVLEHLIEAHAKSKISELTKPFLKKLVWLNLVLNK